MKATGRPRLNILVLFLLLLISLSGAVAQGSA